MVVDNQEAQNDACFHHPKSIRRPDHAAQSFAFLAILVVLVKGVCHYFWHIGALAR
jgi:hypothetical protein